MLLRLHPKLDDIQAERRLRFVGIEGGLGAIEQHLAAFMARMRRGRKGSPTCVAGLGV